MTSTSNDLLEDPSLFMNRELSWMEFNEHVLEEAKDKRHPLLERVKFLAIFSHNLDEFFMIRVSGLHRQIGEGVVSVPADGMSPSKQLEAIYDRLTPLIEEKARIWYEELLPDLETAGIHIHHSYETVPVGAQKRLRDLFTREIFPVLTPLAFFKLHPFPLISNLSLSLAIVVKERGGTEEFFSRVKVPTESYPRLLLIPPDSDHKTTSNTGEMHFVFLEDVISENLDLLFPGMDVVAAYPFRVTRDTDIEIEEDEADDLLTAVEESVGRRRVGTPVRLEICGWMDQTVFDMMRTKLAGSAEIFYRRTNAPIGMSDLFVLLNIDRPELKDTPFVPSIPSWLESEQDIFASILKKDTLIFHPYESFQPVVTFLKRAAKDPDVLAIKMTLYRTGTQSPIIDALMQARQNEKAVTVIVELKARFDEKNNLEWAKALEQAGVHVVYGISGLKVHAKICLVVRREPGGIVRYVHMSSGNYNAITSRIYTDIGFFTANAEIGSDASNLFNVLTGLGHFTEYNHLIVSPMMIRRAILNLINEEILHHREGRKGCIILKLNALQDKEMIQALYRASQAGVKIDLQIRGICCLRPGVPGISDNITVSSIVGRFLEHARIYYFRSGGKKIVYMGSADLMPRNLNRRIELLFPVLDQDIKTMILQTLLPLHMRDNARAWVMELNGTYTRRTHLPDDEIFDAQDWMLKHRGIWNELHKNNGFYIKNKYNLKQ
ncbi:MAG: polyphosphate kinase 1 [Methanomicrobiales archaeon]|jgi:polyphosphate kinase|nr:polyphosphate kinase 1 [Methanomicrobiales archaeon]